MGEGGGTESANSGANSVRGSYNPFVFLLYNLWHTCASILWIQRVLWKRGMKNLRVAGSCKAWKERDSDRVRSLFMESKLVIVGGFAVRITLEMKSKLEHLFLYNLTFMFFSFFVSFLFRVYIYILIHFEEKKII